MYKIILNLIILCIPLIWAENLDYLRFYTTPYVATLQVNKTHFCGGTLIAPEWILTAAHCLTAIPDVQPSQIQVRLGSPYLHRDGLLVNVTEIHTYDDKSVGSYFDDVAVLRLAKEIHEIRSVRLAEIGEYPKENDKMNVYGFGATNEDGPYSNTLQVVQIPAITMEKCHEAYGDTLTDSMFCTYAVGKDACQGDAGGPALMNDKQYGIISWGTGCGREGYPGVYTKIGNSWIRSWIYRKTNV